MESIRFDTVADIYDTYVNTTLDIPFFLHETENISGKILELMCGTGRISIPLLEQGRHLTCVDYSQGMLDVFAAKIKGKAYQVELLKMDVSQLELNEQFSCILLPFHSFVEILTEANQLKALEKIYQHLSQDGTFICPLRNPQVSLKTADGQVRILGKFAKDHHNYIIVYYMNQLNSETGIISGFQFYEFYNNEDKMTEKRVLPINFRLLEKQSFERMFTSVGFTVKKLIGDYSYGEFNEENSPFMIWFLKK